MRLRRDGPEPLRGPQREEDAHRLNGLPARKRLDPEVRQAFLDEAAPIAADVRTLRTAARCPDDAAAALARP